MIYRFSLHCLEYRDGDASLTHTYSTVGPLTCLQSIVTVLLLVTTVYLDDLDNDGTGCLFRENFDHHADVSTSLSSFLVLISIDYGISQKFENIP